MLSKEELQQRIQRTQQEMATRNLDLLFVVSRENLIYFTGTTQLECMALIIPKEGDPTGVTLWLDVNYLRETSALPKVVGYHFPNQSLVGKSLEVMRSYGFKSPRIGFEKYFVEFKVFDGLRQAFPPDLFFDASEVFYKTRAEKSDYEINQIRKASGYVCKGMDAAIQAIRPGATEVEILAEAEHAMLKAGSEGSPFRMQVVSGERALLTHPCATDKQINNHEIVVVHLGATCNGYSAKMCRTIAVGDIPSAQAETYRLLRKAQKQAVSVLKPGVKSWEVDAAAREVVAAAGYENYYLDIVGYGVGLRQSEFYPMIGKGRQETILANMVIDLLLPTIYRKGVGGPRITDCFLVTEKGAEILTNYSDDLVYVNS